MIAPENAWRWQRKVGELSTESSRVRIGMEAKLKRGDDLEINVSVLSNKSLAMEVEQVKENFVDGKYQIRV
ncbi:hypothetical protein V6N11_020475 [Hibiscus sabdariffa]|uniref:Uncharacterized protein n=1 Tax=Hibiscus sabdariffa TaxID=183260 RepID=A0ABR2Q8I1_9ROSI